MQKFVQRWRWLVLSLAGAILSVFMLTSTVYAAGPINWFVISTVSSTDGPAWGRMLPWDQQGDNLVTYTAYPSGSNPVIKVARSNPANPGYVDIASIPSPAGHIQEQSQMVQISNGDILMAMRNRQTDLNWYGLPIVKSTDGGYSWNFVSQLDTNPNSNGRFDRGLWEPFLYVLPNGCVAGFYANEKHAEDNPSYSQVVSERVSCDEGQTWGPEIYAAAQPGSARPGMPGFARMANGQYILVFEVCGTDNCNIHYKFSNDGTSWSNDLGSTIPNQQSGPYVTVLSSGRILVTSACTNQISISDDNGSTWYQNDPPAWNTGCSTWPAIYQTGYNHSNEVGVIVNIDNAIKINFGNY
ncbi:hypothetical protein KSD_64410 [Ktedonobacter sp. SOSP1-85]|uniref:sialidase family protein n=1 Tax=Ktedonobacter sp. SOSP1-85 TaxID=2778367 RepID=UPI001915BEE5|nr:sialidase family protein [Ktedonobacter sp. SOSP1-85]GHO78670.1 hypothetical protein KSD_64410 [Ktedonobacter sp. SOSP1-85]